MSSIDGYVVVTASGKLKKPRRTAPSIYSSMRIAQGVARNDGDAVVAVSVDLEREPLFIRSKKL